MATLPNREQCGCAVLVVPVLNDQLMLPFPSRSVQYGPFAPKNIVKPWAPMFRVDVRDGVLPVTRA